MEDEKLETTLMNQDITIYCHFSFKRPNKGMEGYGLFAVAFYKDYEGKDVICHTTRKAKLWQNHQFVTAIQSYENALRVISELQGAMKKNHINQVMLVTDNSTLAGWIENPKKNKRYTDYMNKAVASYRAGAPKEIILGMGLCEVREYEKSYKYCNEKYIKEAETPKTIKNAEGKRVINIEATGEQYKTVSDMLKEDNKMPEVIGMTEI